MKKNPYFGIQRSNSMLKCKNQIDSSLTKINMPMNKHLMYYKTMVSWLMFDWWLSQKVKFNSSLGALVAFE